MSDQTAIQTRPQQATGLDRVKNYMMSKEVKERFVEMMGVNGNYYLNQVMMVVAGSEDLQKCEPASILISAIRAATLKLSVDPSQGQAWIIPYGGKATFQLGYRGVYELAMRTGKYNTINVGKIYEGQIVIEDQITGKHSLEGARTSDKVVGWLFYMRLTNGFEKSLYMTVEEIDAHAKHYSKTYSMRNSKWNDPFERWKMEKKTVLVNGLRRYGVFDPSDKLIIDSIENDQEWNGNEIPDEDEVTTTVEVKQTESQMLSSIGVVTGEIIDQPEDPQPAPVAKIERPMKPEVVKDAIQKRAGKYNGEKINDHWRNQIAQNIEKEIAGYVADKVMVRRAVTQFLVGKEHVDELTDSETWAIWKWLGVHKDGELWTINADTMQELETIVDFLNPANS